MAENSRPAALVSADELAATAAAAHVVVDCRFNLLKPEAGEAAYRAGHIPGAWYAHLDRDLSGPRTAATGRHPLPDPVSLVALFSRWGIGADTAVVAYDDAGGAIAARLWWLLRWMGHRQVALLDGGLPAWVARGLPLSTGAPTPGSGIFAGEPGHMPTLDAGAVQARLRERSLLLLDARARPRYLGREEPIDPVAGHVPGAVNAPFQDCLAPDGRFRDAAALRATLGGIAPAGKPVAAMCGSGVTACHVIFSLERAGLGPASLYPGSWSEWIVDPARPVAREAGEPGAGAP